MIAGPPAGERNAATDVPFMPEIHPDQGALMVGRTLAFAAALALFAAGVSAAEWMGKSRYAEQLVAAKYSQSGIKDPKVEDTGQTVENGGMTWRIFTVTWKNGGSRHVAVHRDAKGQYLAIEGLGAARKWGRAVSLGR